MWMSPLALRWSKPWSPLFHDRFWSETLSFAPDWNCSPVSWLSCHRLRWITIPVDPKRLSPFADRAVARALRNDSLSSIVQLVAPEVSAIPWFPLSDTTFDAIRFPEPPTTWIPIAPEKLTVFPTTSMLLAALVSWIPRSSQRRTVNPSIRAHDFPDAKSP